MASNTSSRRVEELADDLSQQHMSNTHQQQYQYQTTPDIQAEMTPNVPDLFTKPFIIRDDLITTTSESQDETVDTCLPYISAKDEATHYNEHGVPRLDRKRHIKFLHLALGSLPPQMFFADASRPWFLYWALNALALLGEDVSGYRQRLIETARGMQNPEGGFGGGGRQLSHLATTYAVVLALGIVGGEDCYEVIDRRAMWKWLCMLKQPDGGFRMVLGGEEDIRGAYCAAVIISLLNLPLTLLRDTPAWKPKNEADLFTNLGNYVRRCQTFEGGISGCPDAEAHGAYAFCALACLSILGSPDKAIPQYLNVPRLVSWLSSRQYAPEGGFSGRTNKLVDGCYSHWVGGCWPLLEAYLNSPSTNITSTSKSIASREALFRYILCCCQDTRRGGLRDKPGMSPDAYHTCYVLSGLSSAQHKWQLIPPTEEPTTEGRHVPVWMVTPYFGEPTQIFDEMDRVESIHPVYTIPEDKVELMREYFASKQGF